MVSDLERELGKAVVEVDSDWAKYTKKPSDTTWAFYAESCKKEKEARQRLIEAKNRGEVISKHTQELLDEKPYWET